MGTREDTEIENRLAPLEKKMDNLETKIDKLTELVTQTQLQEYRISVCEQDLKDAQAAIVELDKRAGNTALKWIGIVGTTLITLLLGYIAMKVGLK